KNAASDEARRKAAEQAAAKKAAEDEARRKAAEDEAKRNAASKDDFPYPEQITWDAKGLEGAADDYRLVKRKVTDKAVTWIVQPISDGATRTLDNAGLYSTQPCWRALFLD